MTWTHYKALYSYARITTVVKPCYCTFKVSRSKMYPLYLFKRDKSNRVKNGKCYTLKIQFLSMNSCLQVMNYFLFALLVAVVWEDILWCLYWVWLNFHCALPLLFIEMTKTIILHNKCGVERMDRTVIGIGKALSVFSSAGENWAMLHCPAPLMRTILYFQSMNKNNTCRRSR